jgi:hypothetical protein
VARRSFFKKAASPRFYIALLIYTVKCLWGKVVRPGESTAISLWNAAVNHINNIPSLGMALDLGRARSSASTGQYQGACAAKLLRRVWPDILAAFGMGAALAGAEARSNVGEVHDLRESA